MKNARRSDARRNTKKPSKASKADRLQRYAIAWARLFMPLVIVVIWTYLPKETRPHIREPLKLPMADVSAAVSS